MLNLIIALMAAQFGIYHIYHIPLIMSGGLIYQSAQVTADSMLPIGENWISGIPGPTQLIPVLGGQIQRLLSTITTMLPRITRDLQSARTQRCQWIKRHVLPGPHTNQAARTKTSILIMFPFVEMAGQPTARRNVMMAIP
jgi:hypothetical protein